MVMIMVHKVDISKILGLIHLCCAQSNKQDDGQSTEVMNAVDNINK